MADKNLKQMLRLVAEEVEKERRAKGGSFDSDHPRDELGRFVALDAGAMATHAHNPDAHEDKDYENGKASEIHKKLKERGLLKKADDEPSKLSSMAQHVENQALTQIAEHGRVRDVPLPRDATHLFADYKNHPHKPMSSLLKYIVHRVENHKSYDTAAGAAAADKKFLHGRDLSMVYSRADDKVRSKQHPIEDLHLMLAQKPHLIDQVMAHQAKLHEHLKSTGKIKNINGEPHVALTRGLGAGSRLPDPSLTSFADTHENTMGGRVKFFHNHWVPLKNVWYSYDHGPKEAHPSHYFPAQDEFLVSPHPLKTALSTDVKKLVPRKKKLAATQPQAPQKLASSMTLERVLKSVVEVLRKSGQYTKLDPGILSLGNRPGFIADQRENYKKQLLRGKLDPKDVDKIIQNRNVHINNLLLDRPDLTKEQLLAIAKHKDGFNTSGGAEGNREDEALNKLYKNLGKHNAEGAAIDDIVRTGGNSAIQDLLKYGKHMVHGQDLMKLVTARKDLDQPTMMKVISHDDFDSGHLAEMLHSPHPDAIVQAVRGAGEDIPPQIMEAALTHENPKVRAGVVEKVGYGDKAKLSDEQVKRALDDQDPEVREAGAGRSNTPETARHILDNHLNDPNSSEMLHNMLGSGSYGRYRDTDEDKDWLQPHDLARIVDHAIAKDPALLSESNLRNRKQVPAESIMKIMQMPDGKAVKKGYTETSPQDTKAEWLSHPNVGPAHIDQAMATSKSPEVLEAISNRKQASAEQLREAWNHMPKDSTDYSHPLKGWATNDNTPTDVLNEAAKIHEKIGAPRALINHKNLDPKTLKAFQGHENAQYRAWAAENPNANNEHIKAGLADKDKTVRGAWMSNPNLTHEHLAVALKDRAPSNRQVAVQHPNMTPELLQHVLTKDKDEETRANAIAHKNATPEMMANVLKNDPSSRMREKVLGHVGLTPDLIEHVLKHDKDEHIREKVLKHPNITADLVRHVALNDPSMELRTEALRHQKADPNLISEAIKANPTHALSMALEGNQNLKPEHLSALYNASFNHYNALPTPEQGASWRDRQGHSEAMDTIERHLEHPNAPASIRSHFVGHGPTTRVNSMLQRDESGKLSPEDLKTIYARIKSAPDEDEQGKNTSASEILRALPKHPNFKDSGLLDAYAQSPDEVQRSKAAQHPDLSKESMERLSNDPNYEVKHAIAERPDIDPAIAEKMAHEDQHPDVLSMLVANPNVKHDANSLQRIYQLAQHGGPAHESDLGEGYARVRAGVMRHSNAPTSLLQTGFKDPHGSVKRAAQGALAHHNPDAYNQVLQGAHDIEIHPATEKLKHLKGQVQEAGGSVHKKELPNQGQGLPGQLFNGKGHLTPESIEHHLKSMPHARYNVSYSQWHGAQMHDDPGYKSENKPQKVLQLNMTNEHIKQLKDQGLFDTFKKMHQMSHSSAHPVDFHSLGWARIDDTHPNHWHIDEIQSDFGQNTIRQVEQMKKQEEEEEGGGPGRNTDPHRLFGNTPYETVIDHLKKIGKIFSGPFKNINHAISSATHAVARKEGVTSTSMDTPEDQAKQSNMKSHKELPGHMLSTYKQIPEDIGYTIKPKKEVMPQTKAPETEVQHRKLVKSAEKLKGLANQLKAVTSGRHSEAPAKEAGGKYAPVAKKPPNKEHIRADTQTHLDLKLEKVDTSRWASTVDPSHFGPVHVSPADGTIMVQALTGPHKKKAGDGSDKSWYYFHHDKKTGLMGANHADPDESRFHKDLFDKVVAPHFERTTGVKPGYAGVTNPNTYKMNGKINPHFGGQAPVAPVVQLKPRSK